MAKRAPLSMGPSRWKCPSCRGWKTEPIRMRCAECEALLAIRDEVSRHPRMTDFTNGDDDDAKSTKRIPDPKP